MAFGPIMQFTVGELSIELAPITKDVVGEFAHNGGMQQHSVTRFLGRRSAPVPEDELEWFEKIRTQTDSYVWGIWDITSDRKLIGSSGLHSIEGEHFRHATSGSLIFRQEYWGKGIASAAHKARTWFAFNQLGLTRIKSAVITGNTASQRALEKTGYAHVYIERNETFVDGAFRDKLCLECLNPEATSWKRWWGNSRPSQAAREARTRTIAALEWADEHVTLL